MAGDKESLGWVVVRFTPLLKAQAAWRLGPLRRHIEVDDILAEAWLVAVRRLGDLVRDDAHLTPRLLAFLGTTILHIVNHRIDGAIKNRRRVAKSASKSASHGRVGPLDEVEATITGAVTHAARGELATALDACLATLSEKDRAVVILRAAEGLSNQEAARELGELPTTISHRYRRALEKLREVVPNSFFDELSDD